MYVLTGAVLRFWVFITKTVVPVVEVAPPQAALRPSSTSSAHARCAFLCPSAQRTERSDSADSADRSYRAKQLAGLLLRRIALLARAYMRSGRPTSQTIFIMVAKREEEIPAAYLLSTSGSLR